MTREKKEIIKRLDAIEEFIAVDEALGCGCAPAGAYDELYAEMYSLRDRLARLRGFSSYEAMFDFECKGRRLAAEIDLPFV